MQPLILFGGSLGLVIGLLGLEAVAQALLWLAVWQQPDGRLHVWFLDVGQGDAILNQTPSGRQVLVDGGPSLQALFSQPGAVLPFWDRRLDLLVLTHPDGDHMTGQADVPLRFAVADAWATAPAESDPAATLWLERMRSAGIAVQPQAAGGSADLGDGVTLTVLSPPPAGYVGENASNRNSLVARLSYGSFSALLTGDADTGAALLASHTPLAVLKEVVVATKESHTAGVASDHASERSMRPRTVKHSETSS